MDKNDLDDFKQDLRRVLTSLGTKYNIDLQQGKVVFRKEGLNITVEGTNPGFESKSSQKRKSDAAEVAAILAREYPKADTPTAEDLLDGLFIREGIPTDMFRFVRFDPLPGFNRQHGEYIMEDIATKKRVKWGLMDLIISDIQY